MKGWIEVEVYDRQEKLRQRRVVHNYTFDVHKTDFVASGVSGISRIGIGTDNSAGSASDSPTLKSVLREESCSKEEEGDFGVLCSHTFTYFDVTYDIWEVGLKLGNGKYLTRAVLNDSVTVDPNNNLKVTYHFTVE